MDPLIRTELKGGIVIWQSQRLLVHGVTHGFTTRHGGTSDGECATLDLAGRGTREGHELTCARANHDRLRSGLLIPEEARTLHLHQIHGNEVVQDEGHLPEWPPPKGDILISNHTDGLLMVRVADCVPILLYDPVGIAVAAIHSGWRGTVADAPGAAVRAMQEAFGTQPPDLIAAIGPCIGLDHFEVGEEVARRFLETGLGACIQDRDPRPHIDLFPAVRSRLLEAGISESNIDGTPLCTHEEASDCFSYRRQGPEGGRMAGVVIAPGPRSV